MSTAECRFGPSPLFVWWSQRRGWRPAHWAYMGEAERITIFTDMRPDYPLSLFGEALLQRVVGRIITFDLLDCIHSYTFFGIFGSAPFSVDKFVPDIFMDRAARWSALLIHPLFDIIVRGGRINAIGPRVLELDCYERGSGIKIIHAPRK